MELDSKELKSVQGRQIDLAHREESKRTSKSVNGAESSKKNRVGFIRLMKIQFEAEIWVNITGLIA